MDKDILSPAEATAILKKNVANIVKKSASGKTLTPRELALIGEFSEGSKASPSEWAKSYAELAEFFGCHHHSFPRWKKDFADAPKPRHNGEHSVSAWRKFFAAHPEIKLRAEAGTTKHDLEIERLRQQCRRIKFENDVAEGKYLAEDDVVPALRNIALHQRAVLQSKLERELPTKLVGLTTVEILKHMRDAVDEICRIFRDGIAQWVEAPPSTPNEPQAALDSDDSAAGVTNRAQL